MHRYAAQVPVSLELLDLEPHRDALFTAIEKEREQLWESRAPLLRRIGPHPQYIRHVVPHARPVASVATRTITEFTTLRQEMRKTAELVPAGV